MGIGAAVGIGAAAGALLGPARESASEEQLVRLLEGAFSSPEHFRLYRAAAEQNGGKFTAREAQALHARMRELYYSTKLAEMQRYYERVKEFEARTGRLPVPIGYPGMGITDPAMRPDIPAGAPAAVTGDAASGAETRPGK